jgi:hypothetical protein
VIRLFPSIDGIPKDLHGLQVCRAGTPEGSQQEITAHEQVEVGSRVRVVQVMVPFQDPEIACAQQEGYRPGCCPDCLVMG